MGTERRQEAPVWPDNQCLPWPIGWLPAATLSSATKHGSSSRMIRRQSTHFPERRHLCVVNSNVAVHHPQWGTLDEYFLGPCCQAP